MFAVGNRIYPPVVVPGRGSTARACRTVGRGEGLGEQERVVIHAQYVFFRGHAYHHHFRF